MTPLKVLERFSKKLRCYVSPKFKGTVSEFRKKSSTIPSASKTCLFDFHQSEIDSDMARYLFPLVHEMRLNGYHIVFTDRFLFLATINHKKFKRLVFEEPFSLIPPKGSPINFDIVFSDYPNSPYKGSAKSLHVDYTECLGLADKSVIELPFFVHPEIQKKLTELPQIDVNTRRRLRILFAGNAENPQYDRECLDLNYSLLSRIKALQIAKRHLPKNQLRQPENYSQLFPSESDLSTDLALTVSTTQTCPIPPEHWLDTLKQTDFFLALPGVHMPMCHNLIESLYAGAIPILQYSQYLNPKLENGVNCLTFNSPESLTEVLDIALKMSDEEIRELRKNVVAYRDEYLAPGLFGKQIINHPQQNLTLLMKSYKVCQ